MKSVRLKRSSVASKKPTTTGGTPDLDYGDLALNFNSGSPTLFSRGHDDTLLEWHAGRELPAATRAGDVLTLESAGAAAMQALVMAPYTTLPTYDPRMQPVLASSALPDPNDPGQPYGGAGSTQSSKDFAFIYNGNIYTLTGVADNGANYVGTPDRWLTTGRNASVRAVTPVPQVVPTPVWKPPAAGGGTTVAASEGAAGIAELATQAETDAGTDDSRIVTPLKLATYVSQHLWIDGGSANSNFGGAPTAVDGGKA